MISRQALRQSAPQLLVAAAITACLLFAGWGLNRQQRDNIRRDAEIRREVDITRVQVRDLIEATVSRDQSAQRAVELLHQVLEGQKALLERSRQPEEVPN